MSKFSKSLLAPVTCSNFVPRHSSRFGPPAEWSKSDFGHFCAILALFGRSWAKIAPPPTTPNPNWVKNLNLVHFAYSSSTFITYSPNLSPFLSTISQHLACQDVFPMAGKTVTLSETGADCYNGCRLCSDTGEFMLHFRQILNSFYLTEITDTLYCYHTEFTDTTIYGFFLGHYI